jgi:hypothetical protein
MAENENKKSQNFIVFIIKMAVVLCAATAAYHLFFWFLWKSEAGPDAYGNSYQKALMLQEHALAEEDREPEIIVFGSSYVPFGIDTATVENITGQNCQILGIEAGIGIPILIEILYKDAKPGDTIVYMLGKSNWSGESLITLSAAFEGDKDLLNWYWSSREGSVEQSKNMLIWRKMYALLWNKPVEAVRYAITHKEQVYSLNSFDEKGNMTALREGTQISTDVSASDHLTFEDMDLETMDQLNELATWCKDNDINFVIAYSMNIDGSVDATDEELLEYDRQMREYMKADILLTPQDYFLPVEDFFNHEAHLNTEGAIEYSTILANALNDYLKGEE